MSVPFVGIPSFLRSRIVPPTEAFDADIAVLGAPTDEGSPYLPGSRFAPRSLREHSLRIADLGDAAGYYDVDRRKSFLEYELSNQRIVDLGDADVMPTNIVDTFQSITDLTRRALDAGALPVVLGGDHAISFPVVRAFKAPLHVVHFDAHIDYAPFQHGLQYTNGHAFRHIRRMDHVLTLTQVGIRGPRNPREAVEDARRDRNRVITMQDYAELGSAGLADLLPSSADVYVSLDIDVLDMSLVPGCVSAEPDGMSYRQLRDALAALARRTRIVGLDVVEINPQLDVGTGVTSYLGATAIVEFLGEICDQQWWTSRRLRAPGSAAQGTGKATH